MSHPYSGTSQNSRGLLHRMDRGWRKERPGSSLTSQIQTVRIDHGSHCPQIILKTKAEKFLVTHFLDLKKVTSALSEAKGGLKVPFQLINNSPIPSLFMLLDSLGYAHYKTQNSKQCQCLRAQSWCFHLLKQIL